MHTGVGKNRCADEIPWNTKLILVFYLFIITLISVWTTINVLLYTPVYPTEKKYAKLTLKQTNKMGVSDLLGGEERLQGGDMSWVQKDESTWIR